MSTKARNTGRTGAIVGSGVALWVSMALSSCAEEPSPAPPGVDCGAHPTCGADGPFCSTGNCIAIVGCPSAICIDARQACEETCGTPSCLILESFPEQIACEDGQPVPGRTDGLASCEELEAQRSAELASIQACSSDAECGTDLQGTSCGCTRNLVARVDADLTRFNQIQESLAAAECGGFISTCDCPPADGFACVESRCTWNYVDLPPLTDP
jgi:hypothetical protein